MGCIDIFIKYAVVVPIQNKQEGDVADGILECIHKIGETPKTIYSDKKEKLEKERTSLWSDKTYTIESILVSHSQNIYKVE